MKVSMKSIPSKLIVTVLLLCAVYLFAGCLGRRWPARRITYTADPVHGGPVEGDVTLEPAEPAAAIHVYLKVYEVFEPAIFSGDEPEIEKLLAKWRVLDSVKCLQKVRVEDGHYRVRRWKMRTWHEILVYFPISWLFPAAELIFLADGRMPVVVPLASPVAALTLKAVPENVRLLVPDDPAGWEHSIDELLLPRAKYYRCRVIGVRLLDDAINQEVLAEYATKAYADLLKKFPEYEERVRIEKKIQLLKHPPGVWRDYPKLNDLFDRSLLQDIEF